MDKNPEEESENVLTGIPSSYTVSATHEDTSEIDEIMIKHFLETLADIALSIASRKDGGSS
ncbi:hypothetical protein ACFLXH_01075 [Chloroflexota bacterium]